MIPMSLLDLAPVPEGGSVRQALANTVDLARHAEALGYERYWLAEHHNMPGIASAATSVVIVSSLTVCCRSGNLTRLPGAIDNASGNKDFAAREESCQ